MDDVLEQAKRLLDNCGSDYGIVAMVLRDHPVVRSDADLLELAWCLSRDTCSRNDAIGLIEAIETKDSNR